MSWSIEEKDNAVVVTMTSSKVNVINPGFIDDFHKMFDTLDSKFSDKPVVLTGQGSTFSAGLDFNHVFPIFASGDKGEIKGWFDLFREMILRVFTFDRPLVAAINGHAFAGGLVLALCCEHRIIVKGETKLSLNEVAIGIPMPQVYVELVRYAVGSKAAEELILTGKTIKVEEAQKLGVVHEAVDAADLIDNALNHLSFISPGILSAYSYSKKGLRSPTMERICDYAIPADEAFPAILSSEECVKVQTQTFEQLKMR